jgi:hypothetical protein
MEGRLPRLPISLRQQTPPTQRTTRILRFDAPHPLPRPLSAQRPPGRSDA